MVASILGTSSSTSVPPGVRSSFGASSLDFGADPNDIGLAFHALRTAQHRAHPCHEFLRAERLGDVVVGAQLEADQLVGLVGAGGQHDDRHRRLAPERTCHIEPIDDRQPEVEDDQVGMAGSSAA
jgi:hypothetical protein